LPTLAQGTTVLAHFKPIDAVESTHHVAALVACARVTPILVLDIAVVTGQRAVNVVARDRRLGSRKLSPALADIAAIFVRGKASIARQVAFDLFALWVGVALADAAVVGIYFHAMIAS